ncbi:hypothetical protein EYF80_026371 [Liparis tanakae]|uniref:Uncharacterized protein n=1 Tax=Liparis tanakae TaxID=230148 RepID=A0A4Z2HDS3_9TELE|nr:hypothetical protein EYF80_026371 [Liparis tanakae]
MVVVGGGGCRSTGAVMASGSDHGRGDDAQKEGDDVQDRGGPQQVVQVHHVLAALHVGVFVVASEDLHTAGPVGGTERETAYSQDN